MSVLRSIEQKIEGLFEGMFGRAFRTHVQPVELARKLAKEMDEHRTISVSRVYVPNEYSVYLVRDRPRAVHRLRGLAGRRAPGLPGRARAARELRAADAAEGADADRRRPLDRRVRDRDADGAARGQARAAARTSPTPQVEPGATMIYKAKPPQPTEAVSPAELGLEAEIGLADAERPHARARGSARSCSAARRTATSRSRTRTSRAGTPSCAAKGGSWWLVDLDSTNGTELNGKRVQRAKLDDGDTITLGATELVFGQRTGNELESIAVDEALLVLKIAFLVLLYLFIWRIVRSASRDFRTGAGAGEHDHRAPARRRASGSRRRASARSWSCSRARRSTPARRSRSTRCPSRSAAAARTTSRSTGDEFASAQHARFEARGDGLWVEDVGSTNGTFVNGARVTTPRRLAQGRRRARRPDRLPGGGLMLGRLAGVTRSRPPAAAERGRLRLRAAAVRDRRRDGRRAGGRGRVAASPRRCSRRRRATSAARSASRR